MAKGRNVFKILTVKPAGKKPLGRRMRRWEDNITMNLKEIRIYIRKWIDSAQDRDYWRDLVNVALNLRDSYAIDSFNVIVLSFVYIPL
jgi:hypothetical protein